MKRNYCFSLVLFVALGTAMPVMADTLDESVYASQSIQQNKKITGKVVDSAGIPIIGASVLVKELFFQFSHLLLEERRQANVLASYSRLASNLCF